MDCNKKQTRGALKARRQVGATKQLLSPKLKKKLFKAHSGLVKQQVQIISLLRKYPLVAALGTTGISDQLFIVVDQRSATFFAKEPFCFILQHL